MSGVFDIKRSVNMIFEWKTRGVVRFIIFCFFCFCALGISPCEDSILKLPVQERFIAMPFEVFNRLGKTRVVQKVLHRNKLRSENNQLMRALKRIRTDQETAQLKAQGFRSIYYAGVGQAREFVSVRQYIINIKAKPNTTHIPYFANQVSDHIREIERGIKSQTEDIEKRLMILENFKREAQARIDNQEVTYDWWVIFNMRLSALATPPSVLRQMFKDVPERNGISLEKPRIDVESIDYLETYEGMKTAIEKRFEYARSDVRNYIQSFKSAMNRFPEDIMFFGINDFGYMAFNRMEDGAFFIALSGEKEIFADGMSFNPFTYALHDVSHADRSFGDNLMIGQVEEKLRNMPDAKEREIAELAWYVLRHEDGHFDFFHADKGGKNSRKSYQKGARRMMREIRERLMDVNDLQNSLPVDVNHNDPQQVERFIMESADIISDIVPIVDVF